jgi:hypothetical protein
VIMRLLKLGTMLAFSAAVFGNPALGGSHNNSAERNYILNPGFEQADQVRKTLPNSWSIDVANPVNADETVLLDNGVRRCGKAAARIRFVEAMNYSGVIQKIDVSGFKDRKLQFSGFVRKSSPQSIAGIWTLIADNTGKKLAYINSYEQPVNVDEGWSFHSLSIAVPKDASVMSVGAAIYEKDGVMWVDDLRLSPEPGKMAAPKSCNMKDRK